MTTERRGDREGKIDENRLEMIQGLKDACRFAPGTHCSTAKDVILQVYELSHSFV